MTVIPISLSVNQAIDVLPANDKWRKLPSCAEWIITIPNHLGSSGRKHFEFRHHRWKQFWVKIRLFTDFVNCNCNLKVTLACLAVEFALFEKVTPLMSTEKTFISGQLSAPVKMYNSYSCLQNVAHKMSQNHSVATFTTNTYKKD